MTEFEMAYLLTDMQSAAANELAILFSLLFAFLGASYVAAHRLTRTMLGFGIASYSFLYLTISGLLSRLTISATGLILQMHAFSAAGKGLQWHASASQTAPAVWVAPVTPYVMPAFLALIYVGSLMFLVHCRRVNRKAELAAPMPEA